MSYIQIDGQIDFIPTTANGTQRNEEPYDPYKHLNVKSTYV